ncbi:hypothetical protein KKP97_06270 [Methanothermococcus sp. SCGC AD-155-C09]|nr:hypothetical protein [Methanothermococcus sp. SCGC AD-155-C09]
MLRSIEREVRGKFIEEITPDYTQNWEIKTPDKKVYNIKISIGVKKGDN